MSSAACSAGEEDWIKGSLVVHSVARTVWTREEMARGQEGRSQISKSRRGCLVKRGLGKGNGMVLDGFEVRLGGERTGSFGWV